MMSYSARFRSWQLRECRAILIVICFFALAVPVMGQGEHAPANPEERVRLPDSLELARLVDLAAQRLGIAVEYDPSLLTGKPVTLRGIEELGGDELWELTNTLLSLRNLTTVRVRGSDLLRVIQRSSARGDGAVVLPGDAGADEGSADPEGEAAWRNRLDSGPGAPSFQTVVVRVRHGDPAQLVAALSPLLATPTQAGGMVARLGASDLLLIADLRPAVEDILKLLEQLDVPGEPVMIRLVQPAQMGAQMLAKRLDEMNQALIELGQPQAGQANQIRFLALPEDGSLAIIGTMDAVETWAQRAEAFDRQEPLFTKTYTPTSFGISEVGSLIQQTMEAEMAAAGPRAGMESGGQSRFRLIEDTLTGTLIVTATADQHAEIESIVARLDSLPAAVRQPVRYYKIRNRDAKEVLVVLRSMLGEGVLQSMKVSADDDGPEALGSTATTPRDMERDSGGLLPGRSDPGSRGGHESGTTSGLPHPKQSRGFPAETDSLPPLTLEIDPGTGTLIAMGEPRLLSQLEKLLEVIDVRQPQVFLEVVIVSLSDSQSRDLGVELQRIERSGGTLFRVASLFGLGPVDDVASVTAEGGSGFTGVVLDPGEFSVLVRALETVTDGRTISRPSVLVGNNQPASFNAVLQQPFSEINAGNTVSTTSFGGTQDAGTTISVTPQIAEGDHLLLEYTVTLSSFTGDGTESLPPPRLTNTITSKSTIPDSFTVVVGGLELIQDTRSQSRVPFVGSIPLLGELFKNRSKSDSRSRFYVFIRPTILRGSGFEWLKYRSGTLTDEMGIDDGFPEVKPQIMR